MLEDLRKQIDDINMQMLDLLNQRARIAIEIGKAKESSGTVKYDPVREQKMLETIREKNQGPFSTDTLQYIFKKIFQASLELQEINHQQALLVSRKKRAENTTFSVGKETIGTGVPTFIMGPCAVESYEQVATVAQAVKSYGLKILRAGAFKPRTSPYDFQGLGEEGLKILHQVGKEYDLAVVSEVTNPADVKLATEYLDMIQVGARNMQNFDLLKAVGEISKPVLLKRGLSATIEEFIYAAEYILASGNEQVILCERGIRTFEKVTRNTLDITAVPILKQETHLPVFVDITHSTGRKDLLIPTAKAALAIGADGIMAEVHPTPATALSDPAQQMNIQEFQTFMERIK